MARSVLIHDKDPQSRRKIISIVRHSLRKAFWRISRSEANGVSKLSAQKKFDLYSAADKLAESVLESFRSSFRVRQNYQTVETDGELFNFTGMLLGASFVHTGLLHHPFLASKIGRNGKPYYGRSAPFQT